MAELPFPAVNRYDPTAASMMHEEMAVMANTEVNECLDILLLFFTAFASFLLYSFNGLIDLFIAVNFILPL